MCTQIKSPLPATGHFTLQTYGAVTSTIVVTHTGYKQAHTKLRLETRPMQGQSLMTFDLAMTAWLDLLKLNAKCET